MSAEYSEGALTVVPVPVDLLVGARTAGEFFAERARLLQFCLPWIARLRVSRRCRTNQTLLQEPHRGRMIAERARLLQFCLACIARLRASRRCRTNQILLQEPHCGRILRREGSAPTILFALHRPVAHKSPLSYQSDLAAGDRTAGE